MFGLRKGKSIVGVDLGVHTIKCALLHQKAANAWVLEDYAVVHTPEGALEAGELKDSEAIQDVLTSLFHRTAFRNVDVALAIPDALTITKHFRLPSDLDEADLNRQVEIQAARHIPDSLNEVSFDYIPLGPDMRDPEQQNILLVASRTEHLDGYKALFKGLPARMRMVDVQSHALERIVELGRPEDTPEGEPLLHAVVDLGETGARLSISSHHSVLYSRAFEISGAQLMTQIAEHCDCTQAEASEKLEAEELPEDYFTDVVPPFCSSIAANVERALQLFFSSTSFSKVHGVFLTGGLALLPGLCEAVEKRSRITTEILSWGEHMTLSSSLNAEAFARKAPLLNLAMALAMWGTR